MGGSTFSEIRKLCGYAREIRRYDRDRLTYIERRRSAGAKNFFLDDQDLMITDGATAKQVLADTNKWNHVPAGALYAMSRDPREVAQEQTREWMPARSATQKYLRRRQVEGHGRAIRSSFEGYLGSMTGRRLDVADALALASGIAIGDLVLGRDSGEVPLLVKSSVDANLPIMNSSIVWPGWLSLPGIRRQKQRSRELFERIHRIIADRYGTSGPNGARDILQAVVDDRKLTKDEATAGVKVSLLASFGVPGTAAAWALLALKQSPELERQARREARAIGDPENVLAAAQLLTAIVHEVLRLYPPAWLITRLATEPADVDGLHVAAGCTLNIVLYSIHRDADDWERAAEFEPRRWLEPDTYRKGTFVPFGGGPRVCTGSHLGMVEIVSMLQSFLTSYDLVDLDIDARPAVRTLLVPTRFLGRLERIA